MFSLSERLQAFKQLRVALQSIDAEEFDRWARNAKNENGWFDEPSVRRAIEGVCYYLSPDQLDAWVERYDMEEPSSPKKIGLVMAGNIPLVGFHDILCILVAGHIAFAKPSAQDTFLPKMLAKMLIEIEPRFQERIVFAERMNDVDAMIATGSDNTAKHFEYYFREKPHIIRRNRHAIAILNGHETAADHLALVDDILAYYGLGCRNVSKLFVPEGYDFVPLILAAEPISKQAVFNHKYSNNYDYNKSIYLVNAVPHLDSGSLIVAENSAIISPISVIYYQTYRNTDEIDAFVAENAEKLQCIVSKDGHYPNSLPFGTAQRPCVWEYADGVDTIAFLMKLETSQPIVTNASL